MSALSLSARPGAADGTATRPRWTRRVRVLAAYALGLLAVAVAAVAFALAVTPAQRVSTLGQTVEVGAAAPSASVSGPGELDLFGQSIPTRPHFTGPVRPKLVLAQISINAQLGDVFAAGAASRVEQSLGATLAAGFKRYVAKEAGFAALGALLLTLAYLGFRRDTTWRRRLSLVVAAVVVTEAVNLGCAMLTAYSAPAVLRHVTSLSALVGTRPPLAVPRATGPVRTGVDAVVLGDSTAAGLGNPLVGQPTAADKACGRSADSFAADLATANGWNVQNLACSSATIRAGLLGAQTTHRVALRPQLSVAEQAINAKAIIISVGADDLNWDVMATLCAVSATCEDSASTAYFQSLLHQFSEDYLELLDQLKALPSAPTVVINQYYAPFDAGRSCLAPEGLTAAKQVILLQRLGALNEVLAKGATASGFATVAPDFTGHGMCASLPYVQGLKAKAPFHPTAAGELAIALADQKALAGHS